VHNLAVGLEKAGRIAEATVHFNRAVEMQPRVAARHVALATHLLSLGKDEGALSEVATALAIDPANAVAFGVRGLALIHLNLIDDAIAAMRESARLDPTSALTFNNLAAALNRAGRLEEALEAMNRSVELDPLNPNRPQFVASLLDNLGRTAEALECLDRGLETFPENPQLLNLRGVILSGQERDDEAIGQFRRALASDPMDGSIHNNMGEALLLAGRVAEAEVALRKAVELSSGGALEALVLLGVLVARSDPEERHDLASRALDAQVDHSRFRDAELRSIAQLLLGDLAAAIHEIEQGVGRRRPWHHPQRRLYERLRLDGVQADHVDRLLDRWPVPSGFPPPDLSGGGTASRPSR
jgi:Flp pilus assembly protein TadD